MLPSSRASADGRLASSCARALRASATIGRSPTTSSGWRDRSGTARCSRRSRPRPGNCVERGPAEADAPVPRQRAPLRGDGDRLRGPRLHHGRQDVRCDSSRFHLLRRGHRVRLVEAEAATRRRAAERAGTGGFVTTIDTIDQTVEALCGDLANIHAPRGSDLNARSWATEAPLRMLLNNLDPEVAEHPEELIVYGGSGKAARNHDALRAIVRTLLTLREDETLLVQSGKPVGVLSTHPGAPRVLIANALLVPKWATWDEFRRLEAEGLTMYGQMTAGSWIYIGTQGILQGTYQTFAAAGEKHFGSADLGGRTI